MEITKKTFVIAQNQYTQNPTAKNNQDMSNTANISKTTDTVTLSSAGLELLKSEQSQTSMFGGGTTLPPWPPAPAGPK